MVHRDMSEPRKWIKSEIPSKIFMFKLRKVATLPKQHHMNLSDSKPHLLSVQEDQVTVQDLGIEDFTTFK